MTTQRIIWVGLLTTGLWAGSVLAVPVTYIFTGVVDSVHDLDNALGSLRQVIQPGTLYSGQFCFDSDVADSTPDDPVNAMYSERSMLMTVNLGPFSDTSAGMEVHYPEIRIQNDHPSQGDTLLFGANCQPLDSDFYIPKTYVYMRDSTGTVLSSDAPVLTPLRLADFDASFQATCMKMGPFGYSLVTVNGTITSFEVVPEPASLILLAIAAPLALRAVGRPRRGAIG